ncbi:predicted protein [Nematostella vectensis]|uniref:Uncharacterized protein n=1 Tax=Nematostella vectensis TaxID=45351 RepID=A7RI84_NEMVE|nr:predicted protein [Nematostella vectensis]|eukprot:XP_001640721.1 predicted protein [Nematostella vectensis]
MASPIGSIVKPLKKSPKSLMLEYLFMITNRRFNSDCDGRGLDLYPKYSRNNCYMESLTKYILQQCKCRAWFMADVINTSTCSIKEALDCMWPAWEDFDNAYNYTCPVDCEERVYKTRLSSALFLPQKLLPLTKKYKFLMRPKGIPNDTEGAVDFILENYSVINLFFDELRLDTIQQTPAYGFFRLVGDVGGQLGLVLGASVITIVEIIDLVIINRYRASRTNYVSNFGTFGVIFCIFGFFGTFGKFVGVELGYA